MLYRLFILGALSFLTACSGIQKIAIGQTSDVLYSASFDIENETNWENFEKSVLPNLKMAEGMLSLLPDNLNLLATLAKGYAGYALAVNETLFMDDLYAGKIDSTEQNQAIMNYSKALEYGLAYLQIKGIRYQELASKINDENGFGPVLEKNLDGSLRDKEVLLYSAMSLSSLINLQKNKSFLVAQLPVAQQIMNWVCAKDPNLAHGSCGIFFGAFEASRPKSLGGNPQKGQSYFLDVIKNFPENYLARIFYIQYYIIPSMEEALYKEQMIFLEEVEKKFIENTRWAPNKLESSFEQKRLGLFQAISFKRFHILKNHEKELF